MNKIASVTLEHSYSQRKIDI